VIYNYLRSLKPSNTHNNLVQLQSAFQEKVPAGGCRLWCGSRGKCTGGWTKGLLLVENSMTHQGVTLLHTD
jgi:hypothetical protein